LKIGNFSYSKTKKNIEDFKTMPLLKKKSKKPLSLINKILGRKIIPNFS